MPDVPVPADAPRLVLLAPRSVVDPDGQEIPLTNTQFRLLAVLCGESGRIFSRAELVERGIGGVVSERTVDAHIKEIRRKLGRLGDLIETVRRAGYRFRG